MTTKYPSYNLHDYKGESLRHKIARKFHIIFHDWRMINWTEHAEEVLVHYDPGVGYQWFYYRHEKHICKRCGKRKEKQVYHDRKVLDDPEYIRFWGKQDLIVHES